MGLVSSKVANLTLWRWRFVILYTLLGLLFVGAVFALPWLLGFRLTAAEEAASIATNQLSFDHLTIANLPYMLLQKLSLSLFGLTALAIKLPSIVLGLASGILLIFILNRWFKNLVALTASGLAIFSVGLLGLLTTGTPAISYVFFATLLVFIGSLILDHRPVLWQIIAFFATLALMFYVPYLGYFALLMLAVIVTHPHLRFTLAGLPKFHLIIGAVVFLLLLVPLILGAIQDPTTLGTLFLSGTIDIGENARATLLTLVDFRGQFGLGVVTPFFQLPAFLLILTGLFSACTNLHRARDYTILAAFFALLPACLIMPKLFPLIVLPAAVLVADGLRYLLQRWQNIFPLNPYATTTALIPLLILIVAVLPANFTRFFYSSRFDARLVALSNNDLALIRPELKAGDVLIVTSSEAAFYAPLADDLAITVTETRPDRQTGQIYLSREAREQQSDYIIKRIIASSVSTEADRFFEVTY